LTRRKSTAPCRYLDQRQFDRALRGADAGGEEGRLLAAAQEARQARFDVGRRLQHGVLEGDHGLLEARVRGAHVVGDAAIVEHRPMDAETDEAFERVGVDSVGRRADPRADWNVVVRKPVEPVMLIEG